MRVYRDINDFKPKKPIVLTQGTFDGVHVGHKKILSSVVEQAKLMKGESVLLTFYPHPRLVLYPADNSLKLLSSLAEKEKLVRETGIDHMVVLPFTKKLSRLKPEFFVRDILINALSIDKLIIGYDHRFGRNREGSLADMIKFAEMYDFELEEIPAQDIDHSTVSSTKIRAALNEGDIETANALLGRNYSLQGVVEHGKKYGKEMGFPTANISVNGDYKLIPANGVYAVKVDYDGVKYGGMLNIGYNPTFTDKKWSIEVHIFEFQKDIYNETLEIAFVKRMRNELMFSDKQDLIEQIKKDEIRAREILVEA